MFGDIEPLMKYGTSRRGRYRRTEIQAITELAEVGNLRYGQIVSI